MTAFEDSNNIVGLFTGVNNASGNILGYLTLISVFIVILMALLRNNPPAESIFAASFVSSIVSLLFMAAGITNIAWFVGCVIMTAASAIALYTNNK